jgi:hypothetical protein
MKVWSGERVRAVTDPAVEASSERNAARASKNTKRLSLATRTWQRKSRRTDTLIPIPTPHLPFEIPNPNPTLIRPDTYHSLS